MSALSVAANCSCMLRFMTSCLPPRFATLSIGCVVCAGWPFWGAGVESSRPVGKIPRSQRVLNVAMTRPSNVSCHTGQIQRSQSEHKELRVEVPFPIREST